MRFFLLLDLRLLGLQEEKGGKKAPSMIAREEFFTELSPVSTVLSQTRACGHQSLAS